MAATKLPPFATGTGTEATAQRVTLATDSTGLLSVDDNGADLSIDINGTQPSLGTGVRDAGTLRVTVATDDIVPASQSGTWNITNVSGTVSLPTGAATAANQLADGHNVTVDNGAAGAAVNIQDGGNDISVDWAGTAPPIGAGTEAAALRVTMATNSTGVLSVDDNGADLSIDINGTQPSLGTGVRDAGTLRVTVATNDVVPASQSGTWNITNVSGTVSLPTGAATAAGQLADGHNVTVDNVAGTNPIPVEGTDANDAALTGNPVLLGAATEDAADAAPANRIATEGRLGRLSQNGDGALYVVPSSPQQWSYHENSSSALTDATVHASPGAGLSLYVTDIICSTGAATALNIFFEEATTTVLGPYYLEAVNGRGLAIQFQTPKKITAATALTVTTSAAIAHGIDVHGFIAPG